MPQSTIQIGDQVLTFEDLPKRAGIRWAVGTKEGVRSSTWRLWGDPKGDVYVAVRNLGGVIKASFHRDRRCHVGLTAEAAQRQGQDATARHFERWRLPDTSVVRVAQVIVPHEELRAFSNDEADAMKWLPVPGAGHAQVVSVFIAEPPDSFDWNSPEESGQIIGAMWSKTRLTWAVHMRQQLDATALQAVESGRQQAQRLVEAAAGHALNEASRLILWGNGESPEFACLELAAPDLH